MNVLRIATAIIVASVIPHAAALDFASADTQLAPIGWAALDSSYAAAAGQVDRNFPGITSASGGFSPEEFSATVESGLEKRLEARLEQDLNSAGTEARKSVNTN